MTVMVIVPTSNDKIRERLPMAYVLPAATTKVPPATKAAAAPTMPSADLPERKNRMLFTSSTRNPAAGPKEKAPGGRRHLMDHTRDTVESRARGNSNANINRKLIADRSAKIVIRLTLFMIPHLSCFGLRGGADIDMASERSPRPHYTPHVFASSPIQTILSAPEFHRISHYGSRAYPIGFTAGQELKVIPSSPSPEDLLIICF